MRFHSTSKRSRYVYKPGILGGIRVFDRGSFGKSFPSSFHDAAQIQPRHYCFIQRNAWWSRRRFDRRLLAPVPHPLPPLLRLPPLLQLADPLARPHPIPRRLLLARHRWNWIIAEIQIGAKVSESVVWMGIEIVRIETGRREFFFFLEYLEIRGDSRHDSRKILRWRLETGMRFCDVKSERWKEFEKLSKCTRFSFFGFFFFRMNIGWEMVGIKNLERLVSSFCYYYI